jgi:hypothetical protein
MSVQFKVWILFTGLWLTFTGINCKKDNGSCPTCPSPPTDTTSHNFTWTKYLLGDGAGSCLYDVAIINDTCIWAVGEIQEKDSMENWRIPPYNVAKWNGQRWELLSLSYNTKILYPGSVGSDSGFAPAHSLFVFNENDIWIAAGTVQHFNGFQWQQYQGLEAGFCNRMWGSNSTNMYFVGKGGAIVHLNGTTWTKIESGTTLSINDIWGDYNTTTKQWEILTVAGDAGVTAERKILSITGNTAVSISDSPLQWPLSGVWFVPCQHYYVVGDGIYEKNNLTDTRWRNNPLDITAFYTTKVRGSAINNVFIVGTFGEVLHNNGSTWQSYRSITAIDGTYGAVVVRGNMVVIVGQDNQQAVVAIGRR